jgi:preprotein translocase subunit YajC
LSRRRSDEALHANKARCQPDPSHYISRDLTPGPVVIVTRAGSHDAEAGRNDARPSAFQETRRMFATPAFAQDVAPAAAQNPLMTFVPFIFIFVIFYFLLIRPQQQARKKHMDMVANVKRGDVVITSGGIVGKVSKVLEGDEIMVDIADGVAVKVIKHTISDVRSKTDAPANDKA